jgi:endonuclease YncB( thermonuclease family)
MPRTRLISILVLLSILPLFAVPVSFAAAPIPAHLVAVTDGDTIKVVIGGEQIRVRLHGIDAPEKKQAFGQAATDAMKQLTAGRSISIQETGKDRYGRTVALVFADGVNANEAMVRLGMAWVYPQYCRQAFCDDWYRLQHEAQLARRGLWRDESPTPPWEWRHDKKARKQAGE